MRSFLAYAGAPLLLADLLYRPSNSLIMQSYRARERPEPLNGDGFGVGWYVPEVDPTPCVQRSLTPAWPNRKLQSLALKTRAAHLFAHIRAATPGMVVTETNAHPFADDRFMRMRNGAVAGFQRIKRRLRESLKEEFYDMIEGTTDSERAFAVFLHSLHEPFGAVSAVELRAALVETIARLNEWTRAAGITETSYYNFAVTDGQKMVVSRYATGEGVAPRLASLRARLEVRALAGRRMRYAFGRLRPSGRRRRHRRQRAPDRFPRGLDGSAGQSYGDSAAGLER